MNWEYHWNVFLLVNSHLGNIILHSTAKLTEAIVIVVRLQFKLVAEHGSIIHKVLFYRQLKCKNYRILESFIEVTKNH